METKVSYTIAGTFVLILLLLIIISIVWLSAGFNNKKYIYYKVYMKESVSGLKKDGPVEFNGVNVGNIYQMKINKNNPQLVELILKVESDTPVTMGTRAKLGMRALTGNAYMLLEDKGGDMRPIVKPDNQKYAVIPTTPSILIRLETALMDINNSFRQVSASITALLNKNNLRYVRQILESGKNNLRTLEVQTIPAINETAINLGTITRDLSSVSADMKENPAVIIRGKQRSKLGPGE